MIAFEDGIVNIGNTYRLKKTMERGRHGGKVTVGFLGGSITQGSLASSPERCYARLVYRWWAEKFTNTAFINAGIGGTTSQFGAARVEEDLLRYSPDVIFVEFSVNDENTAFFMETYEGLIRKLIKSGTAVVLLHNICYDTGISAEEVHLKIGKHYCLPCVSIRPTIYRAILDGKLSGESVTPDDLHPNDRGHALIAEGVTYLLEKVYESEACGCETECLPAPLTDNRFENSIRHQNHNSRPVLDLDHTPQEHITQMFRRGFTARNVGDRITFQVPGSVIAVQYRKTVMRPAPIARVTVDGEKAKARILDANFRENWGDCLYIDTVLLEKESRMHTVEIEIIEAHEEDASEFYLVSVIGSE